MATPTCSRCGKQHYNFKKCDPADLPEPTFRARETVRQPRADGLRPWGDQLETLHRIGGNTFGNVRRHPAVTGRIRMPDGSDYQPYDGPEAA